MKSDPNYSCNCNWPNWGRISSYRGFNTTVKKLSTRSTTWAWFQQISCFGDFSDLSDYLHYCSFSIVFPVIFSITGINSSNTFSCTVIFKTEEYTGRKHNTNCPSFVVEGRHKISTFLKGTQGRQGSSVQRDDPHHHPPPHGPPLSSPPHHPPPPSPFLTSPPPNF